MRAASCVLRIHFKNLDCVCGRIRNLVRFSRLNLKFFRSNPLGWAPYRSGTGVLRVSWDHLGISSPKCSICTSWSSCPTVPLPLWLWPPLHPPANTSIPGRWVQECPNLGGGSLPQISGLDHLATSSSTFNTSTASGQGVHILALRQPFDIDPAIPRLLSI
jgi:hypothetical protein